MQDILKHTLSNGSLTITSSLEDAPTSNVYIITVGTPLDANGKVRLDMVKQASSSVATHMPDDALIVLRSTLKLGTTRDVVLPILKHSKKILILHFVQSEQ